MSWLEVRSSGQARRTHILESRQLMIIEAWKFTLCWSLSFLKKHGFPTILCVKSHSLLQNACLESFCHSNFPWQCNHMEGPHTHRERQTNIQTPVSSHSLWRREPVSLGQSGKFQDTAGSHPECEPGHQRLMEKFTFFSKLALKWHGLATAWKPIQLLFLYFWQR